jgi:bis(5'-adenosyl)-triphosphatase
MTSSEILCPFCDSANETSVWLETPDARVLYNIAPIVPGHSLAIPRRHVASLLELSEAELAALFQTARAAVVILLREFGGAGFDLSVQDGEAAGQTVPHVHVHIVPRKPGDLGDDQDWYEHILDSRSRPRLSPQQMQPVVARLRLAAQASAGRGAGD